MMATAVSASKPAPYHAGGGKVKRSQQQMPYGNGSASASVNMNAQTGVNGVRATQPSPTLAAANRPKQPLPNTYAVANGVNGRTVAKRKEPQKNEEVDVLRRGLRPGAERIVNGERRKISPEPHGGFRLAC